MKETTNRHRIFKEEFEKTEFLVDVTDNNVCIVVLEKDKGGRGEQRFSISPKNAEHLMGLLSEALYGMRR